MRRRGATTQLRAIEGAIWGSVDAHGLLRNVGQFAVGLDALCWIHAERMVHKLDTCTDLHSAAQQRMHALICLFRGRTRRCVVSPGLNQGAVVLACVKTLRAGFADGLRQVLTQAARAQPVRMEKRLAACSCGSGESCGANRLS